MPLRNHPVMSCLTILFLMFLLSCAPFPPRLTTNNLHNSVAKGKNDRIKKEILSTKNIDEYDAFGRTALHLAVLKNNKEIVNELISNGADINKITLQGNTPLSLSVRHDDLEIANLLLDSKANVNVKIGIPPLSEAVKFKRVAFCKKLVEKGADVNSFNRLGETPLFYAVYLNLPEIVNLLLSNGAIIDSTTIYGMTPLHAAAISENSEQVKELLLNGAKINPVEDNEKGLYSTAFLYAIIGELYELEGRNKDAVLTYKEASKFYQIGVPLFSKSGSSHFYKNLKEGLLEFSRGGGLIGMWETTEKNVNIKLYNSERTDYITSGLKLFKEIHPEYFETQNKQKKDFGGHREGEEGEASASQQLGIDIVNLYENLSEKFADYSILYSKKAEMLSDVSSKSSYNTKYSKNAMPTTNEIKWVDKENNLVNLYIYRKPAWCAKVQNIFLYIDGSYYDKLMCNKYFIKKVQPGNHYFISPAYVPDEFGFIRMMQNQEIIIDKINKDYFIEVVCKNTLPMSIVSKDVADAQMKRMELNQIKIYQ